MDIFQATFLGAAAGAGFVYLLTVIREHRRLRDERYIALNQARFFCHFHQQLCENLQNEVQEAYKQSQKRFGDDKAAIFYLRNVYVGFGVSLERGKLEFLLDNNFLSRQRFEYIDLYEHLVTAAESNEVLKNYVTTVVQQVFELEKNISSWLEDNPGSQPSEFRTRTLRDPRWENANAILARLRRFLPQTRLNSVAVHQKIIRLMKHEYPNHRIPTGRTFRATAPE